MQALNQLFQVYLLNRISYSLHLETLLHDSSKLRVLIQFKDKHWSSSKRRAPFGNRLELLVFLDNAVLDFPDDSS